MLRPAGSGRGGACCRSGGVPPSGPCEKNHVQNGNGEDHGEAQETPGWASLAHVAEGDKEDGAENPREPMLDARSLGVIRGHQKRGGKKQHQRTLPPMPRQQFDQTGENHAEHEDSPDIPFAHVLHRIGLHVERSLDEGRGNATWFWRGAARERSHGRGIGGTGLDGIGVDAHAWMVGFASSQVQRKAWWRKGLKSRLV